jgi:cell division protein FtsI (penicillin-binding protein 3)
MKGGDYRNRAVKDLFEPGSTSKPFTIAAALESGEFTPSSIIDTSPGHYRVSGYPIKDIRNHGKIDLGEIIAHSSNVGVSKVAMKVPKESLWNTYRQVGFGQTTGSGFPGEVRGVFRDYTQWYPLDQATLSFGYGYSVTPLQLARAYSVIAADGVSHQISFLADPDNSEPKQVMSAQTAKTVRNMMKKVVQPQGTGYRAAVEGYQVAGKTGTVKKAVGGGYSDNRYVAIFAGMAPASSPGLVTVVVINEPSAGKYYGGQVAAPVFSRIMAGALRQLNIPPDDLQSRDKKLVASANDGGAG